MKRLVSLSGGMDSTTVLAKALYGQANSDNPDGVLAVGFTYGSKHNKYENRAAQMVADSMGVPFILMDLTTTFSQFQSNLLKSGGDIPEGHYAAENMKLTVVPGRNLIFISILAGLAESLGFGEIWLGIHQGDHAIYPDCRPEFFRNADAVIRNSTEGKVRLAAPFLDTNKEGILRWGLEHKVPYHLTRTCYKDQPIACGKCGSCVERREAFTLLGKTDPIQYETEHGPAGQDVAMTYTPPSEEQPGDRYHDAAN